MLQDVKYAGIAMLPALIAVFELGAHYRSFDGDLVASAFRRKF
jgi:hypothetical protein